MPPISVQLTQPFVPTAAVSGHAFEHLQMFRTHVSRNLCLEILEHARFIPQPSCYGGDVLPCISYVFL